jgi:hypothetical protein
MNYQDIIGQIYQQYLGRQPTSYEMQGFTSAMNNNILDPIGLMQFVQSTSEYQQKVAPQNAQAFASQLQGLQQQSTNQTLQQGYDSAVGRYAQMGRPDSTGLGSSFAQVAGQAAANNSAQTAQQVGGYLGGVYGGLDGNQQGYGQNFANNYSNYANNLQNFNYQNALQASGAYRQAQNSMGGQQRGMYNMNQNLGYAQGGLNLLQGVFGQGQQKGGLLSL